MKSNHSLATGIEDRHRPYDGDQLLSEGEPPTVEQLQRANLRTFVVSRKERESRSVMSFYLRPEDGGSVPRFRPGQYLTFELCIPGQEEGIVRTYTVSDCWRPGGYRVSIKREQAAAAGLPNGVVSSYFHDYVEPGTKLRILEPRGRFFLDEESDRPIVLLSGGVGVTPMISMLNTMAAGAAGRAVWFIHGCRNGAEHVFADHVRQIADGHANVRTHVCYSRPRLEDVGGRDYDSRGHVTIDLLRRLLPFDGYDFYLCGPMPFMQSIYNGLRDLEVPESRIRHEFFGPAAALRQEPVAGLQGGIAATPQDRSGRPEVRFVNSGITARWDPSCDNLLEFAEAQGLTPDFGCRSGICETCMCGLVAGQVEYVAEPLETPGSGQVLICCSRPKTDIELNL